MFQMKYPNVKTIIITDDFVSMKEGFVMLLKYYMHVTIMKNIIF